MGAGLRVTTPPTMAQISFGNY